MMRSTVAVILSVLLLMPAAGLAQENYILGPGDVLEVTVFGFGDLTRVVTIGPDGRVSLPLAGVVTASGLTVEQLAALLAERFALYLKNPQVTVSVREFRKIRVSVLGQVARPGTHELRPGATVLDALSAAGGLTDKASVTQARLVRASGKTQPLQLEDLLLRQDMRYNLTLQPGDTLMVPEETNNKIYILGDVNSPGVFVLRSDLTLLQALALAGGPAQRGLGTPRSVHIIRRSGTPPRAAPGVQVERLEGAGVLITVDLQALMRSGGPAQDLAIAAGDIIVVPQSGLSGLQAILSILSGLTAVFR